MTEESKWEGWRAMIPSRVALAWLASIGVLFGVLATCLAAKEPPAQPKTAANLHPKPPAPLPAETLQASIDRGIAFLLKTHNTDASWCSADRTNDLNIYAPVPGAHHAFCTAVTAMCVSALIEVGDNREDVRKAIDRGEAYLFAELAKVRRAERMAI